MVLRRASIGIDTQLITEIGAIKEDVFDEQSLLARLFESIPDLESTHCIQYVDPYGDTIFNRQQVSRLLEEWKRIEALAASTDERILVRNVRRLATSCKQGVHLYLKFVGD